jgi:hypothetical protein
MEENGFLHILAGLNPEEGASDRRMCRPQPVWTLWNKNIYVYREQPWCFKPVALRYTDWASSNIHQILKCLILYLNYNCHCRTSRLSTSDREFNDRKNGLTKTRPLVSYWHNWYWQSCYPDIPGRDIWFYFVAWKIFKISENLTEIRNENGPNKPKFCIYKSRIFNIHLHLKVGNINLSTLFPYGPVWELRLRP